jgi:hypothetical protein
LSIKPEILIEIGASMGDHATLSEDPKALIATQMLGSEKSFQKNLRMQK